MNAPTLEEYKLRPEDLEKVGTIRTVLAFSSFAGGVVACLLLGGVSVFEERGGCLVFLLQGSFMIPIACGIVYFILAMGARLAVPVYGRVARYRSALEAYESWWRRTQVQFWQSLSGLRFEQELAALFCRTGIQATVTTASGDKGVDIWFDENGRRIPVQCKAHKKPIGPGTIREFIGAM